MVSSQTFSETNQRALEILNRLKPLYLNSPCPLNYETPLQLLVAVILAAQCTDARVNQVTPQLFGRFPDAAALAGVDVREIETMIKQVTFPRNKARNVQLTCRQLIDKFKGEVPPNLDELVKLPGVGRKTATMVLHYAFGMDAGVMVDIHVKRLSQRMGFSNQEDIVKVEQDLMKILPVCEWGNWFVCLTYHGRAICPAKKPACEQCVVASLCPSSGLLKDQLLGNSWDLKF